MVMRFRRRRPPALLIVVALAGCPGGGPARGPEPPDPPSPTTGRWPDPVSPDGAIGADASVKVESLAADGSWLLLCQAQDTDHNGTRSTTFMEGLAIGDRMLPTLVLGSGEGGSIDAPLATSVDDRWLAVWRTGGLHLIDVRSRQVTEVTPVLATDRDPPPIAAAFSGDGAWMAWSLGATLTMRALDTGAQLPLELEGRIWSLEPAPGRSTWVRAEVVSRDTDGDGAVVARWGISDTRPSPCSHPWDGGTFGRIGDEADVVWIDLATGDQRTESPAEHPVEPPARAVIAREMGNDRVVARDVRGRRLLVTRPASDGEPARGPLRWAP